MNKKYKFPIESSQLRLILPVMVIVTVCILMVKPIFGIIIGILAWISYKKIHNEISNREMTPQKDTVNEDTNKLILTLVSEQETLLKEKPLEYSSYLLIKRGTLPTRVHDILDEMGITTWTQLSALDEKEMLYEKCFGKEALAKIKTELGKRGLSLNGA
jgi:DNA-directed RNA polymerase alpha subunit